MQNTLLFIALALLVPIYLNSNLELSRQRLRFEEPNQLAIVDELPLSSAWVLNYNTLAADIAWLDTLIRHGEMKRDGLSPQEHLLTRGREIAAVDPLFYPVYEWVPAAYMIPRHKLNEEELMTIASLMDIGIQTFSMDSQLPFSAAMNFIGKSDLSDKNRRVRELTKAVDYLKISAERPNAREDLTALISAISKRIVELEAGKGQILTPLPLLIGERSALGSKLEASDSYLPQDLARLVGVD